MAILIEGLFGSLSGKLGDVVYRKKGGKTIVARRPKPRQSPLSEREIIGQKIFGLTGKIAKTINAIELLKYFWHRIAGKNQSSYHLIFKKNYAVVRMEDLPGYIFLTPSQGFLLINQSPPQLHIFQPVCQMHHGLPMLCIQLPGLIHPDTMKGLLNGTLAMVLKKYNSEDPPSLLPHNFF